MNAIRNNWIKLVVVAIVATIVMGAGARLGWRRAQAKKLAQLEARIATVDPFSQVRSAQQILDIDAYHMPARLALADALITLGRGGAAHQTLEPVLQSREGPHYVKALHLSIDACLREAHELLRTAAPRALDLTVKRVEHLTDSAATAILALDDLPQGAGAAAGYRAAVTDLRAALIFRRLHQLDNEYAKIKAAQGDSLNTATGRAIQALKNELRESHHELRELCQRALQIDPDSTWPSVCLFRAALREGKQPAAMQAAAQLIGQPSLSRWLAGDICDTMLSIESTDAGSLTAQDLKIIAAIMNHENLLGCESLRFNLAQVALALYQGQFEQAKDMAKAMRGRYPDHPRGTALLAMARVRLGQIDHAMKLLTPLNDRVRFADGRYVEAVAHLAAGKPQRAHELLRQCLEMNGRHLPAMIVLAESLADTGHIDGAARDISTAFELNPRHPRVLALYARLIIMQSDRVDLVNRLRSFLAVKPPTWSDAAIAADMVRDDAPAVAELATHRIQTNDGDFLALICLSWTKADPSARAEIAMLVAATLLDVVDDDPLRWPDPPMPMLLLRRERSATVAPSRQLIESHFIATPYELALELVDVATQRWPDQTSLRQSADKLRSYVETGAELAANEAALAEHMAQHPWAHVPLLHALGAAIERKDIQAAQQLIVKAREVDPLLARLVECRANIAMRHATDALHGATILMRDERAGVLLNFYGAESAAQAHVLNGSPELAVGLIENLGLGAPYRLIPLKLAAADVLLESRRDTEGIAALVAVMADRRVEARWLDQMLARAAAITNPQRMTRLTNLLLHIRVDDPLVLVYQAWALAQLGNRTGAHDALARAATQRPDSPRVLMLRAALQRAEGRTGEARAIYEKLLEHDGRVADAARRELSKLGRSAARRTLP